MTKSYTIFNQAIYKEFLITNKMGRHTPENVISINHDFKITTFA